MDVVSNIPDGVLVIDENGRITLTNPQAEKLLALEAKLDGKPLQQFIESSQDTFAHDKIQYSLGDDEYQCARVDLPGSEDNSRHLIMVHPVIKTSSLPTEELWSPVEQALEIAEWLKEQTHSGRQESALDRMRTELMTLASLLMEIDPQLKAQSQEIERNTLEIPPEIEAKMKSEEA